ncbi:class I SAM-dependent methyltransferase [Zhongshania aquimaris]|uniref:Methyltransferase n=1 Tax=Zhongshania aquimaris TaxID=2857107 RepID=A0ABS6VLR0_9GAMM|nr:methyltransferase [Zhongshania aquimaris]MBW2939243.1 methyltransferase [Zhongshania aquimaris]
MKRIGMLVLVQSLCIGSVFAAPAVNDLMWAEVLDADHRSAQNHLRDEYRHPLQTLLFFGVQPCDSVVELWPGGGWYTEILTPIVKDCGKLYTAHFATDSDVSYYNKSRSAFDAKLAKDPAVYQKVVVTTLQPPAYRDIAPAGSADKVLTFRNVHNWLKSGVAEDVFAAAYKALKPGGIFGVVEHRADPDASLQTMIKSGYVSEKQVIALAESAGFLLLDSSEINANSKDNHDHPAGVWTLPPSLRLGDQQREKYLAIGESDRMTLKFGKPVHE